jgi:Na+/melibiose symporter-like transporter
MFCSAFPIGIFFYFLYQPPSGLEENQLFYWYVAMYVGLNLSKTFYGVPHSALGAELSRDYNERTKLFGWNWVAYYLGAAVLPIFIMSVIFASSDEFENGLLNAERYQMLATVGAVFVTSMVLLCTFLTADRIPYLHEVKKNSGGAKRSFAEATIDTLKNLWALATNISYVSISICWLILFISGGVLAQAGTYTHLYVFEFSTEILGYLGLMGLPGAFLVVYSSAWFVKRLDKKYTVLVTSSVCSLLIGLPYCLRLMGWLPDNDSVWMLPMIIAIWIPGRFFLPIVPTVIDSQMSDIADEHELRTGNRSEGIIFSVRTFGMKATRGIGGWIGAMALDYIGFPEDAKAETLEPEVISGLLWMMGPLYILIVWGGLGITLLYRIDRKRHAEILKLLEERKAKTAEQ